jgi:hypothetical protein
LTPEEQALVDNLFEKDVIAEETPISKMETPKKEIKKEIPKQFEPTMERLETN